MAVTLLLALTGSNAAVFHAPPRPSPGCSQPPKQHSTGVETMILKFPDAGLGEITNRTYYIKNPSEANTPVPLVLNFHGYWTQDTPAAWGNGAQLELENDHFPDIIDYDTKTGKGDAGGFIIVYPLGNGGPAEGVGNAWAWNVDGNIQGTVGPSGKPVCRGHRTNPYEQYPCFKSCTKGKYTCNNVTDCRFAGCPDDTGFIQLLVKQLLNTHCIDLNRVHLVGFSTGGMLTYQLTTYLPQGTVASIVATEGGRAWGYNKAPASPVSVLDFHGTIDGTMPANETQSCKNTAHPDGAVASCDEFYYTPNPDILKAMASGSGCNTSHGPTAFNPFTGSGFSMPAPKPFGNSPAPSPSHHPSPSPRHTAS